MDTLQYNTDRHTSQPFLNCFPTQTAALMLVLLGLSPLANLAFAAPASTSSNTFRDCPECPEMVTLPNKEFAIGKYEVTFDEWNACISDGGCNGYQPADGRKAAAWGLGKRPVIYVSWGDTQTYLQWLSKKTGKTYRLPKESEWEYACYGGNKKEYCGNGKLVTIAWYDENSEEQTHPVGQKQANEYGLYDMSGNVWEWTDGCGKDNLERENCNLRIMRGGSWNYDSVLLRAAIRLPFLSSLRSYSYGFRVVREP